MPLIHSKQCKTEATTKRCIRLKGYYQITKIPVSWSILLFVRTSNKDHPKEMFSLSKTAKKFSFSGFINLLLWHYPRFVTMGAHSSEGLHSLQYLLAHKA